MDHLIRGCLAVRQREEKASREDDHDIATQKRFIRLAPIFTRILWPTTATTTCVGETFNGIIPKQQVITSELWGHFYATTFSSTTE